MLKDLAVSQTKSGLLSTHHMYHKPSTLGPEEVRYPCTFLVINIVLNVQMYMGAWA